MGVKGLLVIVVEANYEHTTFRAIHHASHETSITSRDVTRFFRVCI